MTTLSLKNASKHICLSESWLHKNMSKFERGLHYLRVHGRIIFIKEALDKWLIEKDLEDGKHIYTREKSDSVDQAISQWKRNQKV